jgi:type VI secretion system protein ImpB
MAVQDEIPKSRLTLKYRTEINGQPEDVQLPLRLTILGDFSQGSSQDRKMDLEERRMRNLDGRNTDAVMKDMGISLKFSVPNKVDPDKEEDLQVEIPFESMKSFSPEKVAENVPKLKGLVMLKKLMEETMANVDNRKDFRRLLGDLLGNQDALAKMLEQLKGFEGYKLPSLGEQAKE